jgi:flagellin
LQQSNDATLERIAAVKERNNAGSAEGIRFLSTLSEFRVSIGATEQGGGLNSGTATVLTSDELSGGAVTDVSTKENAENAVSLLSTAVSLLGAAQAVVGKGQNRLQFAVSLAATQVNNISAAQSRIRDADLAAEAASLTRASIAQQAGIAALAQANSAPQVVLALLRA